MSMQGALVECVPNFSEGRDKQLIEEITRPIRDAKGVSLLDIDMGQAVVYVGDVLGGPLQGESGTVKRLYGTKALVDLGLSVIWNVPYYLLAKRFAA